VFLSPDGEWVGYLTRTGIGKARTTGGAGSQLLALNLPNFGPIAASWGDDGRIYFADERGIHAVPAGGGPVATIVTVENVTAVHVLPGSQALLYSRGRIQDKTEVVLHAIGGDGIVLGEGLTPRFVPPDTVLWVNDDSVKAARLDLAARRLLSAPVLALEDKVARLSAFAQYDVSEDGTIVFVPAGSAGQPDSTPAIRARTGTIRTLTAIVHQYSDPRLSPDGRRLALHLSDLENDVWVLDLDRGALTRITHHPEEDETPVWSADGQWIAFSGSSRSSSGRSVFRRRADGSGGEEELWTGGDHTHVTDWSRDGRVLLLESAHAQRRSDVLLLDVAGKATTPLIATAFNESSARLSPDGRWIAYQSDESGQLEVYVQSFPALDRKVQVSTQGGVQPVWARDGTAVHFRTDTTMESSRFHVVDGSPRAEAPVKQFDDTFVQPQGSTHTTYDVMADGSTIVFQPPSRGSTSTTESHIIGVFNWIDEVRAKLPPR
jgi:serine/threonine-protein kinase